MLVSQGKVEEAIAMRHGLHQYEEALALGRAHRLPEDRLEGMAQEYFRLLLDTKQEERAAALKEKEVCVWLVCLFGFIYVPHALQGYLVQVGMDRDDH